MKNLPAGKAGNKFTTYLLYAIGEIVLVVIGIFIAIQLNNLNENRKLKNKEATYYCKLLEDVTQDAAQLELLLNQTNERIKHSNLLISLLQEETLNFTSVSKEMLGSISMATYTFKPNTSVFEDIKSSGNLSVLDQQVRKALIEYYSNIEGVVDVVDINSDQSVRVYNKKDSYTKVGWHLIPFVDEAIDGEIIDKELLKTLVETGESYRNQLTSDAIYIIGASARVKMLYETLATDISSMQKVLQSKCQN